MFIVDPGDLLKSVVDWKGALLQWRRSVRWFWTRLGRWFDDEVYSGENPIRWVG
jgi:hypothetical protein